MCVGDGDVSDSYRDDDVMIVIQTNLLTLKK